ncbi:MAG: nitroreductase family protein [Desulfosarcinaceae bacterium]
MAAEDSHSRLSGDRRHLADLIEDLITARRSIRRYTDQPVPEAWIEAVLRCGIRAPSASNSQPVRFVRISSPDLRKKLHQALLEGYAAMLERNRQADGGVKLRNRINAYHRYAEFMVNAPVLLAVGTSTGITSFAGRLVAAGLMEQDPRHGMDALIAVGLALKGMLLKAQALGLGSCILSAPLVFIQDVEGILSVPDVKIACFLALGFPAESPLPSTRLALDAVYREL